MLGGILIFALEGENQKGDLLRAQEELTSKELSVSNAEAAARALDEELAAAAARGKTMQDNKAALEAAKDKQSAVEKDLAAAQKAWEAALADTNSAIKNVRAKYWKQPPATIKLTTGEALQNAMVRNIEGTSVIVEHADGIKKGNVDMLPAELQEMLGININTTPPVFTLKEKKAVVTNKSSDPVPALPVTPETATEKKDQTADASANKPDDAKKEDPEAIRKRITELEKGIGNAEKEIEDAQLQAYLYMKTYNPKVAGGVSNNKVLAENELAKVTDLRSRIARAKKMIGDLKSKL